MEYLPGMGEKVSTKTFEKILAHFDQMFPFILMLPAFSDSCNDFLLNTARKMCEFNRNIDLKW